MLKALARRARLVSYFGLNPRVRQSGLGPAHHGRISKIGRSHARAMLVEAAWAAANVRHEPHVVGAMAAHVVLPWVHRAFSNAKTWALGVYHGLRKQHLQSYLNEFVFRFNRRRTRHAPFRSLLAIALVRKPLTHKMLIKPEAEG